MHQLACQFCVRVTVGHQSLQPGLQRRQKNETFLKLNSNNKLEGEHIMKSTRRCILAYLNLAQCQFLWGQWLVNALLWVDTNAQTKQSETLMQETGIDNKAEVCVTAKNACAKVGNLVLLTGVFHISVQGVPQEEWTRFTSSEKWGKREFCSCFLLLIKGIYFCFSVFLVSVFLPHWPKNSTAIQEKKKKKKKTSRGLLGTQLVICSSRRQ